MSDMTLLRFISTGNLSQTVSCPPWLHCVSHQQETFRIQFPIRHSSIVFHLSRKPFANSFLSDMTALRFISTGNFSQAVSCPTWLHCVSHQQETFCEWFPTRHCFTVFHLNRKPFANSFLSAMAPLCFTPTGNFLHTVSCPPWLHCVLSQQETFRKQFPVRHGSIVLHTNRKLFSHSFPLDMAPYLPGISPQLA